MSIAISKKSISVIIPAYNEEKNIKSCLESLSKQSFKNFEAILVDDFSEDNTVEIAQEFGIKVGVELCILRQNKHQERGIVRNLGAKEVGGKYLFFIDADMQLEKDVLKECIQLVNDSPEIKAIIIPEESFGQGFWAQCRRLEKKCYLGDDRIEAARFFEKKAFWEVGGWDKKMVSGEDWDLTRRIRFRFQIGRIKSFIYHNEYKLTLWKAIKKKFYYASVSGIFLEKNPLTILGLVFFIFRPAYLRNWKLILSDPIHGAGMFFLKGTELTAGLLGFLYSKLGYRVLISPLRQK